MTRINVVHPKELSAKHLVAEYREITRLPNNLKTSLSRKSKPFCLAEVPQEYTLGKGHVKFFYTKMLFLRKRFEALVEEMLARGYNPTYRDSSIFYVDDSRFNNDYIPTEAAILLNKQRIAERTRSL